MQKIIISTAILDKPFWNTVYNFINSIINKSDDKTVWLTNLHQTKSKIYITSCDLEKDPCQLYGEQLLDISSIEDFSKTVFSIIYEKQDDKEDFADLVPFFILKVEFRGKITLGIDLLKIPIVERTTYEFKSSAFLRFIADIKPTLGARSIYFIDEQIGYNNKYAKSLKGKSQNDNKNKESKESAHPSRRYLPLLKINNNNYLDLFGENGSQTKSEEATYISEVINSISPKINQFVNKKNYASIFEEWLVKAYFYSFNTSSKKFTKDECEKIMSLMRSYYNNIYELVQNVIFHTETEIDKEINKLQKLELHESQRLQELEIRKSRELRGLIYFVFNNKNDISSNQCKNIIDFNNYHDKQRFIEIGIIDFNKKGIVETFNSNEQFDFKDFFDLNFIKTTSLSHIDLRPAAHLGIKTFVKSIINHKGYFRVESNNKQGTKDIVSLNCGEVVPSKDTTQFVSGTHYEIILPVVYADKVIVVSPASHVQSGSFINKLKQRVENNIPDIKLVSLSKLINGIDTTTVQDKEEQIELIKEIGDKITQYSSTCNEIALDMCNIDRDANIIFKLLSYIQLSNKTYFEKIILINLNDSFIDDFCSIIKFLLIDTGLEPIWSNKSALILISSSLRYQMICGKTKDDLYGLNYHFEKYYCTHNNFFKGEEYNKISDEFEKFLLPYEVLIERDAYSTSCFEGYINRILKKPIESEGTGYLVGHENTYIGSKLIVRNYYEADSMFQNSFYADRFAYLIAKKISKYEFKKENRLVIIGYKNYSELLINAIKQFLPNKTISFIAHEDNDSGDIAFDITHDITFSSNDRYITIVPIGSTLSTNDKIVAFFKREIKKKGEKEINVIHNHCAIIVRDQVQQSLTDLEKQHKWEKIDTENKIINTKYANAEDTHFDIQIASKDDLYSNWLSRINNDISFPKNWWQEKYINLTENASINSQNLMGYPILDERYREGVEYDHDRELDRLYELKANIYSGHIINHKSHYRYYIDTESFLKRENIIEFNLWIEEIASKINIDNKKINVIITPNARIESEFVKEINRKLFNDEALIVYLDVDNWRNNIIFKLSYLKNIYNKDDNNINFHYVDHALLTAEVYRNTKSYLNSILENQSNSPLFTSIITLINRLSSNKEKDIREDIISSNKEKDIIPNNKNSNFYTFINLFIPPSKDPERDCILCALDNYYKKLKLNTVVESCLKTISRSLEKIELATFDDIKKKKEYKSISDRKFLRLFFIHKLFYTLSSIKTEDNASVNEQKLKEIIDSFYNSIFESEQKKSLYEFKKLEQWFYGKEYDIDKKISFLKVISSPPVSQYINIRKYALEKLLYSLHKLFEKDDYEYNDLLLLCAILKSLSFFNSNALIRKEVIIKSWRIYYNVLSDIDNIIKNTREEKEIINDGICDLKDIPNNGIDFEKEEKRAELRNIEKQIELLNEKKKEILKFKGVFQFYIKNSIAEDETKSMFLGELLRTGEELTLPMNDEYKISKTVYRNDLFTNIEIADKAYIEFLVWVFYDNTTIIRKTLNNFEKEFDKDTTLRYLMCDCNDNRNEFALKEFEQINIADMIRILNDKVNGEYYYANFKSYLNNLDNINIVEKLIYVLYAKKKLENLNEKKRELSIETDIISLLDVLAKIMGADNAFLSINHKANNNCIYAVSNDKKNNGSVYLPYNSYTHYILSESNNTKINKSTLYPYPIIIKKQLDTDSYEKQTLKSEQCSLLLINDTAGLDSNLIATITFLYKTMEIETDFKISCQESGRILLLLKEELNKYVIDFLINKKVFDLWVEKKENQRKFDKIYLESDHSFGGFEIKPSIDFDNLNKDSLIIMARSYFSHTNRIICHLYANIEKENELTLFDLEFPTSTTLLEIFNENFISLLQEGYKENINSYDRLWMGNLHIDCNFSDTAETAFHKQILRAITIQCIDNAMYGKHLFSLEKNVIVTITDDNIIIQNDFKSIDEEIVINKRKEFEQCIYESIRKLKCHNYSFMTLTALQGYCTKFSFDCDYSFDKRNNFTVKINLKQNSYD